MMYALCNYRITNINVGSNLFGYETSLSARKLVGEGYASSLQAKLSATGRAVHGAKLSGNPIFYIDSFFPYPTNPQYKKWN